MSWGYVPSTMAGAKISRGVYILFLSILIELFGIIIAGVVGSESVFVLTLILSSIIFVLGGIIYLTETPRIDSAMGDVIAFVVSLIKMIEDTPFVFFLFYEGEVVLLLVVSFISFLFGLYFSLFSLGQISRKG